MKAILKAIMGFMSKKPKLTGRQINMWEHTGWGDAIHWRDFQKRKLYGHLYERPKLGDIINSEMQSGKVGQFVVVEVEYMRDPPDQFFCKVSDFGYKEKH